MPDEAEVHGLVALMEFQSSRLGSRIGPTGEAVLLLDQDRRTWDQLLIRRGIDALACADGLQPTAVPTRCKRRSRAATPEPFGRGRRIGMSSLPSTPSWPS